MATVEERVERRLTAILAADVAGYSRLMGTEEERTLAALKGHRREIVDPKIAEHRGRIVKTTGDGVLVEFASVVDAVRCAVEVQRGMAERNAGVPAGERIEFRVGINLGDIIIDDGDIFGDGVNVAARLEALAEPGGICVSRVVRDQVRDKLDFAFEDMGEQQVKNIARPVRVFRIQTLTHPVADAPWSTLSRVAGEGAERSEAREGSAPALALPDKPSIAVLPFQNMSGDPEQEYFADGMVEVIITALSRIRWLFVIARNSSFTYKGQAVDLKQVGRELGVRYVLEGSVRKGGNRVRITAQLIEAEIGSHLWADRFDGLIEDVFELQDQIAASVAGVIEPALEAAEVRRSSTRATSDPTAYDLYLRSLPLMRTWDQAPIRRAIELLDQAIERDPGYGLALSVAAWSHAQLFSSGWAEDVDQARRDARDFAQRAVRAAPDDPNVLANAAGALGACDDDAAGAASLIDRSLALNPGSAYAWFWSGYLRLWTGLPETAIEHFETSLRLDPRTPLRPFHQTGIGIARFMQKRYEDAVSLLLTSLGQNPTFPGTMRFLAASYAHMGRLDAARDMVARLRAMNTQIVPRLVTLREPASRELFLSGLRLAIGQTS